MVKPQFSPKRQRTRAALVEATAALVAERGLGAVSLDDIAARAGVTKGAIYSNFRTKAELLWEAVDRRRLHLDVAITPGDARTTARDVARALMAQFPQAEAEAAFYAELQAYIRTDPEMRAQQAAQQKAQFDEIARRIEAGFGAEMAVPSRVLGLAVQALLLGFTMQWERTPDEVTQEVVAAAFETLVRGARR
ncbi:TetR/AcrR family transcriptional regulator [Phenylobacterium sp.]|uniref:TetR/AcrR family transcriptional regulator n=1 Tax=Phenylobacterium sp. TaxID=1871053 RepID=UPI002F419B4E